MSQLNDIVNAFEPEVPIERAWTPPASWYTSREIYTLERESVFRRSWQPVARLAQVEQPGSYVAGCMAGEPWVVVRGHDGELRAFFNTCRHKGREVVMGEGHADQLVCGYHAWTYDLDGALRKAPQMAGIEQFDRAQMSLVPMSIDTWGPWVFVSPDAAAPPLRSAVVELDERLERTGWSELVFAGERSWEIECNWKVYVDNYLDGGYHVPHMHPSLAAQLDMAAYRTELFERFSIQTCPASTEDARLDSDARERIGGGAIYAWIYPNFMLNRYGPCLDTNHVVPLGPASCRVDYQFFFEGIEGREADELTVASMEQSDVTQTEDIAICESVQRGLGSQSYDRGRYAPRVEIGEHHFHRLLSADYRNR